MGNTKSVSKKNGGEGAKDGGGGGAGRGSVVKRAPPKKLTLDDFELMKTVGRGSFGKVIMVKTPFLTLQHCVK